MSSSGARPAETVHDSRAISSIRALPAEGRAKRDMPRCAIELDGVAWTEVDAEVIVRLGLKTGQRISAADEARILHADETIRARRWAAARCASRPRSRRALERELRGRRFGELAITEALDALAASGTLNDLEVAARHLRKRRREGGYGPDRLRSELMALGLSHETAEAALAAEEGGDPLEACLDLARKRAARYEPLSEPGNRAKLMRVLQRRGFEPETIYRAMERLGAGGD